MERFILSCKLIGVAILVIAAILSLTPRDAYGLASATASFGLPPVKGEQPPPTNGTFTQDEIVSLEEIGNLRMFTGGEEDIPGSTPCIPEPATLILMGAGIAGLRLIKGRR